MNQRLVQTLVATLLGYRGPQELLERVAEYRDARAGHVELKFIAHSVPQLHEMMARLAEGARLLVPTS